MVGETASASMKIEAVKPIVVDARAAKVTQANLQKIAKGQFSLNTLRTMDPKALLEPGKQNVDPKLAKPAGILFGKPGWAVANNTENQAALQNAKAYAAEQAVSGLAEIGQMKKDGKTVSEKDIAAMTSDELFALAKANGKAVDLDPGDATKSAEAQKMRDYLENAQGLAKEKQEAEQKNQETEKAQKAENKQTVKDVETALSADAARELLELQAAKNLPQAAENKGKDIMMAELKKENPDPEQVAFGLDLQIAGLQMRHARLAQQNATAHAGGDTQAMTKTYQSSLEVGKQIKELQAQRDSGKIKVEGEKPDGSENIEKTVKDMPKGNQIEVLAEKIGADTKIAEVNPLGGIQLVVSEAAKGGEAQQMLLTNLKNAGFEAEKIANVEAVLKKIAKQESTDALKDKGKTVSILLLLLIAMGGYAAFQKNKQAHGAAMAQG